MNCALYQINYYYYYYYYIYYFYFVHPGTYAIVLLLLTFQSHHLDELILKHVSNCPI